MTCSHCILPLPLLLGKTVRRLEHVVCGEAVRAGFICLEKRSLESEGETSPQSSFALGNARENGTRFLANIYP